jgi:hypothetical protein
VLPPYQPDDQTAAASGEEYDPESGEMRSTEATPT